MKMENLSDDLLIEIWSRVPCKMAVRCKSISKRFLALISLPRFMERSICHHHTLLQHMQEEEDQWHLTFISRGNLLILFFPTIHLCNLETQNQNKLCLGTQFEYPEDETKQHTRIVGCSNGLLLCKKSQQKRVYFVSNPITKDCLQLPPFPRFNAQNVYGVAEGFVCEPYYNYNAEGNTKRVTFNHHRFRVVRISPPEGTCEELVLNGITKFEIEVVVFSSETGQWSTKLVSCPKGFTQIIFPFPAIAHKGKLYFMGRTSLAVYDPFNIEGQIDTIQYPSPTDLLPLFNVGVCCGNIRIFRGSFTHNYSGQNVHVRMRVWELEQDFGWHLVHDAFLTLNERVEVQGGVASNVHFREVMTHGLLHPHHEDVVFFHYRYHTYVANLKTKLLHIVGDGVHNPPLLQIISLDLPCWPTPLPSIQ